MRTTRADASIRDAGPMDAGPVDTGPPVIPDEPLEPWDETDAGPLSGLWAVEAVVRARIVVDVESRQLFRLRVLQRGRTLRLRTTVCALRLPEVRNVAELAVPEPLERVLHTRAIETEGEFLSSESLEGATFAPEPVALVLGADVGDPFTDPLPTPERPERARDEDDDGHPGVTVLARTLLCPRPEEAYLALRTVASFSAVLDGSTDIVEGDVEPRLEWSFLGFSAECLAAARDLRVEIQPGSRFVARRVGHEQDVDGNGNVSCPELAWHASRLFGEAWLP